MISSVCFIQYAAAIRNILGFIVISGMLVLGWAGTGFCNNTVTVYNPNGSIATYTTTIQAGINACLVGGTVSVSAGTYTEAVYVNKGIALVGAGSNSTTITASGLGGTNTVTFNVAAANNASISGFRITGATGNWPNGMGIYCGTASPTITNNTILWNGNCGICCNTSSPTITNNTISGNSHNGIYCNTSSPSITNNTISGNSDGISCSSSLTITNNTISENSDCGIICFSSSPIITNNTISGNSEDGIYCLCFSFFSSSSLTITNNTISGNSHNGIYCYYSSPTITNNIITENGTTSTYYHGVNNDFNMSQPQGTPTINYNCV